MCREPWLRGLSDFRDFEKTAVLNCPRSLLASWLVAIRIALYSSYVRISTPRDASKCHSSYDDLQDRNPCILPGIMKQKRMVRSVQHCVIPPSLDAILLI
jgi:hypothetical protein